MTRRSKKSRKPNPQGDRMRKGNPFGRFRMNYLVHYKKRDDGCWQWLGSTTPRGYGVIRFGKAAVMAHRYFYEVYVDEIHAGLVIDHICRNRSCVNPKHMEAVTQVENTMRGFSPPAVNSRRDNCICGPPFDTVWRRTSGRVQRACKTCGARRSKERREAERGRQGVKFGAPPKVSPADAEKMKRMRFKTGVPVPAIAAKFNVSAAAVYQHTKN